LCEVLNIDPSQPLTEKQLCAVVILYANRGHKITTVPGFISAIANYAITQGHPPLPRLTLFNRVKAGLNNWFGDTNVSTPVEAFTLDDLCSFHSHLDLSQFQPSRDWCACLFAFFGLLRVNEYMGGQLKQSHVRLCHWGISLTIPFSKTSLIPTSVDIIRRDDELCPQRAYAAYVKLLPRSLTAPHLPLFFASRSSPTPLSDSQFIDRIRSLARVALPDRDANSFAGHSFRRGGTSALFLAGVPEATIATHGRWKSLAYRDYLDVQNSLRVRLMATAHLRAHKSNPLPGLIQP
jgi:hypothetical protein